MLEVWSVQALVKEESSGLLMKTLALEKELVELQGKLLSWKGEIQVHYNAGMPHLCIRLVTVSNSVRRSSL